MDGIVGSPMAMCSVTGPWRVGTRARVGGTSKVSSVVVQTSSPKGGDWRRSIWTEGSLSVGGISRSGEHDHVYLIARRYLVSAVAGERGAAAVSIEEVVPSSGSKDAGVEEVPTSGVRDADEKGAEETGVIVIGAGLAGLAAARCLATEGIPFRVVEASDGVGGRVRTDTFRGFLLDRGFQIHITAYPEAARILDYEKLNLKKFYAGASVWFNGRLHRVADPRRHFVDGLISLTNPIGSVFDKILVGAVVVKAALKSGEDILSCEETSIEERLLQNGFSKAIVDRFFRPFFGGIFFDNKLQTTSRLFDFVFKCLALGSNTLPASGIGAIPGQLAAELPNDSVLLNSKVAELVEDGIRGAVGVKLEDGSEMIAKYGVVVAVEGPEAFRLLGTKLPTTPSVSKAPRSTICLYFSSDTSPTTEPILFLNGSGEGIVNNMFFPSAVAPTYAPPGKTLVSVSLIGTYDESSDAELELRVLEELRQWFGAGVVGTWEHLRTYRIPFAQPDQSPPTDLLKDTRVRDGVYVCGDHRDSSTFDGALMSGRRAVQSLIVDKVVL